MTTADIFNVGRHISGPAGPDGAPGTVYTLRDLTLFEQGEFQRWLEQRAHDAVDRSTASEAAKDRRHAQVDRDAALGLYEYDGPLGLQARWSPAGLAKAFQIACRGQGVTEANVDAIMRHALKEVAATLLLAKESDPGKAAAALAALGLPTDWTPPAPSGPSSSSCSTPPSTGPSTNSGTAPTASSCSSTPSSAAPTG